MPQPQRSSRNRKIEPLSWEVAAQSPALKGMTSFLDIPAEDIRAGRYVGALAVDTVPPKETLSLNVTYPTREMTPEDLVSPGDETGPGGPDVLRNIPRRGETAPLMKIRTMPERRRAGSPTRELHTPHPVIALPDFPSPARVSGVSISLDTVSGSGAPSYSETVSAPAYEIYPGDETYRRHLHAIETSSQVTPGRGRSKVRRCVLAQDGHSLGEEAIYQVMWRGGRPESQDPNASRTIRIGAADIGFKVNMAKKNVRQNVSRLYDKLALEILEDFETMSSQPRLYRVFSYKQILERRRAAGMEFVLRNKGVVFCTSGGEEIVTSPAYVTTPGDETSIRPAPPKKRRTPMPPPIVPQMRAIVPLMHAVGDGHTADVRVIAEALNRYWPVDEAAAEQLLRDCRRVRADARAEEIVFFVAEKLELARTNRNITNPTGLVLATVPKSFAGATFESFRERMERQSALVEEEKARRDREQEDLRNWLYKEREKNEAIVNDAGKTQQERDAAEKKLRQYSTWNP